MSVTLKIRKCTSEEIRLTKSFVENADVNMNGVFRENEDLLNPIITVETSTNLSDFNYVEITQFGRSYFMWPEVVNNKLWRLHCRVDVLSTYAAGIKDSEALVKRTEADNKINFYINDGALYTEQREKITYHKFKKGNVEATFGTDTYYLIVAGG